MSDLRFDGRVAVITGAGRGLGREYALLLASKGAKVLVNDNGSSLPGADTDGSPAGDVVAAIKAAGGEAAVCTESVATAEGGAAIVQAARDHLGKIDILIHNAGNLRNGALDELSHEDFKAVLDVHLMGAFHVLRPAFPLMKQAGYGRIVLTSSIGGFYGYEGVTNYAMAKAGMIGLGNVAALEGAAFNIKCNIIAPGAMTRMAEGTPTEGTPMRAEQVAPVVGWLTHESCPVTGEIYSAIAGRVARVLIAETPGVYRPSWTIDAVADQIDAIRDVGQLWLLPPVPHGLRDHLARSFEMVRKG